MRWAGVPFLEGGARTEHGPHVGAGRDQVAPALPHLDEAHDGLLAQGVNASCPPGALDGDWGEGVLVGLAGEVEEGGLGGVPLVLRVGQHLMHPALEVGLERVENAIQGLHQVRRAAREEENVDAVLAGHPDELPALPAGVAVQKEGGGPVLGGARLGHKMVQEPVHQRIGVDVVGVGLAEQLGSRVDLGGVLERQLVLADVGALLEEAGGQDLLGAAARDHGERGLPHILAHASASCS